MSHCDLPTKRAKLHHQRLAPCQPPLLHAEPFAPCHAPILQEQSKNLEDHCCSLCYVPDVATCPQQLCNCRGAVMVRTGKRGWWLPKERCHV